MRRKLMPEDVLGASPQVVNLVAQVGLSLHPQRLSRRERWEHFDVEGVGDEVLSQRAPPPAALLLQRLSPTGRSSPGGRVGSNVSPIDRLVLQNRRGSRGALSCEFPRVTGVAN